MNMEMKMNKKSITPMTQAKNRAQRIKKEMRIAFEAEITNNRHALSASILSKEPVKIRDMQVRNIGFSSLSLTPAKKSIFQSIKQALDKIFYEYWGVILFTRDYPDSISITQYELQKERIRTEVYVLNIMTKRNETRTILLDPNETLTSWNKEFALHIRSYKPNENDTI